MRQSFRHTTLPNLMATKLTVLTVNYLLRLRLGLRFLSRDLDLESDLQKALHQ